MAICPICKSDAHALDKIGLADGFDCLQQHGKFKTSSTVQITQREASREKWEAALRRARTREPAAWAPVVVDDDFL
jgi:hypothetical protein